MRWTSKLGVAVKLTLYLLFTVVFLFVIAHLALQFGVQAGEIPQFLAKTWFIWLIVRIAIYASIAYFLYQLLQRASEEADKLAYKKLARALVIGLIVIELVVFVQRVGG